MGTPSLLTITIPETPLCVLMRFKVSSTSDILPDGQRCKEQCKKIAQRQLSKTLL